MNIQRITIILLAIATMSCSPAEDKLTELVESQKFDEATQWINENPESDMDPFVMVNVARHYREKTDYPSAQALLEKTLKLDPENVPGRLLLANVYREQTAYNKAIVLYDAIVNIDSVRFIVLPERARLYIHLNEFEKAEKDIVESKNLQPKYYASFLADGLLQYAKGDVDNALDLFEIAEQLDPGLSAESSLYAGVILLKAGISLDAMDKFSRAIEVGRNINKGYAFINRGICQLNIADTSFACVDWDSARVYMPDQAKQYIDAYCGAYK